MGDYLGDRIINEYKSLNIDVVIPVPDTSRTCAMQVAHKVGKNTEKALRRIDILEERLLCQDSLQEKSVAQKLNPIALEFRGKNVLLVDDSIVRGHTSKKIIQMVRMWSKKVSLHLFPPVRYQNVYGIDMPATKELIAHKKSIKQIKQYIGADELIYKTLTI